MHPLGTAKITDLTNSSFLLQDISFDYEATALEENSTNIQLKKKD